MIMRVTYGVILAIFLCAMPVFAQDQSSGAQYQPPSPDQIVAMMQSKLDLTQDQVTAVTPIIEKYSAKRDELRQSIEDGTADRDAVRGQMKQVREDETQELSQILSADQLSQFKKMMSQHRHRPSNEGQGAPSGGSGEGVPSNGE